MFKNTFDIEDSDMTLLEKFIGGGDMVLDQTADCSPPPRVISLDKFMELCSMDNCVFYTITLRSDWHCLPLHEQHEYFFSRIRTYFDKKKLLCYFVPELTKAGNMHLHGIILTDYANAKKLMNRWIRMVFGFYKEISPIKNSHALFNYIHKDNLYEKSCYPIISNLPSIFY